MASRAIQQQKLHWGNQPPLTAQPMGTHNILLKKTVSRLWQSQLTGLKRVSLEIRDKHTSCTVGATRTLKVSKGKVNKFTTR